MQLQIESIPSPIGTIELVSSPQGLCGLDFGDCHARLEAWLVARYGGVELVPATTPSEWARLVGAYLDGDIHALDDVPADTGGTPFQREVWAALRRIPVGTTATYGEIAARLGRPGAARAVGLANSQNPVALVVPCHRVVGANGTLTGYAGGLDRKRWLLQHEGASLL